MAEIGRRIELCDSSARTHLYQLERLEFIEFVAVPGYGRFDKLDVRLTKKAEQLLPRVRELA